MRKLSILFVIVAMSIPCAAGTIIVNWDGSGDYTTIQAGIDAADPNDTVIVAEGTYTGAGNWDINFGGKAITVRSADPNDFLTVYLTRIMCGGSHRGFIFNSGEGPDSVVEGLTIYEGYAENGGGIYCIDSSPTIKSCQIAGCTASDIDAGIDRSGGGIFCIGDSSPAIIDCLIGLTSFDGNYPEVYPNSADDEGGGIYCGSGSSPVISGCWIAFNVASLEDFDEGRGGGIYCGNGSSPVITGCWIENNGAGNGGGIACIGGCTTTISNCVICLNYATDVSGCTSCGTYGGGGIYSRDTYEGIPATNINNCTIIGNQAINGAVGGVYAHAGVINLSNCIVWDNTAVYGSEIGRGHSFNDCGYLNVSYCDIKGGLGGVWVDGGCSTTWGPGNIDSDPCFVYWIPFVELDGHLKSQAEGNGSTSPCIDAGNPGCSLGNEPIDPNNFRINMGAYGGTDEASMTPPGWGLLCDVNNDWSVNTSDLVWLARYWGDSGECIPADFNRDQIVNVFDFVHLYIEWLKVR